MHPRPDDPRPHHYQYAHRALPSIVRQAGLVLVTHAEHRDFAPALHELWAEVGSRLPDEQRLAPDGLSAAFHPDPEHPLILITLPAAQGMTEAHFAAIVASGEQARYLVLEHSWSPASEQTATMIGEWNAEGHLNLGPGPAPRQDAFVQAVRSIVGPTSS